MEINISKAVLRFVMVATLAVIMSGVTPASSVLADGGPGPLPCPGGGTSCLR
jgi:hypothetical protein